MNTGRTFTLPPSMERTNIRFKLFDFSSLKATRSYLQSDRAAVPYVAAGCRPRQRRCGLARRCATPANRRAAIGRNCEFEPTSTQLITDGRDAGETDATLHRRTARGMPGPCKATFRRSHTDTRGASSHVGTQHARTFAIRARRRARRSMRHPPLEAIFAAHISNKYFARDLRCFRCAERPRRRDCSLSSVETVEGNGIERSHDRHEVELSALPSTVAFPRFPSRHTTSRNRRIYKIEGFITESHANFYVGERRNNSASFLRRAGRSFRYGSSWDAC